MQKWKFLLSARIPFIMFSLKVSILGKMCIYPRCFSQQKCQIFVTTCISQFSGKNRTSVPIKFSPKITILLEKILYPFDPMIFSPKMSICFLETIVYPPYDFFTEIKNYLEKIEYSPPWFVTKNIDFLGKIVWPSYDFLIKNIIFWKKSYIPLKDVFTKNLNCFWKKSYAPI